MRGGNYIVVWRKSGKPARILWKGNDYAEALRVLTDDGARLVRAAGGKAEILPAEDAR